MSKRMKLALIGLSLVGVAASWVLPALLLAVHNTHAYSMLVEFRTRGMINETAEEEWRKQPGQEDYSLIRRMKAIGGLRHNLSMMSLILTVLFGVNIICIATTFLRSEEKV